MATVKKPAKTATRKALAPSPAPAPRRAAIAETTAVEGADKVLHAVGVDPRTVDGSAQEGTTNIEGSGYTDERGHLHAAPPTPTRESAATANDAPGAGGSMPAHAPRRTLLEGADVETVKVRVTKPFRLTDAAGVEHQYDVTTTEMPKDHAEHWYAEAHDVQIVKK